MSKKDNFTVEDVKRLREKTGKGLFACVKALREHDGDEEKAIKYLKNYNDIIMY